MHNTARKSDPDSARPIGVFDLPVPNGACGGPERSVSDDDGATWAEAGAAWPSFNAASLIELADGRFVTFGNASLLISDNQEGSWEEFGPALPYEPNGVTFSPDIQAFYIWRFDCNFDTDNDIPADAIMRLHFVPAEWSSSLTVVTVRPPI